MDSESQNAHHLNAAEKLSRGLRSTGLTPAEIDAVLAYSEQMDREFVPSARDVRESMRPRLAPWRLRALAVFAAALLVAVAAFGWTLVSYARANATLHEDELVLLEELRDATQRESRLVAQAVDLRRSNSELRDRVGDTQRGFLGELWQLLGERAAMGDERAPHLANLVYTVSADIQRPRSYGGGPGEMLAEILDPIGLQQPSSFQPQPGF